MARVLAVDYGTRRIGLAVSDETGLLARPLAVVPAAPADRALAELGRLARELEPAAVIVGNPRRLDGSPGTLAAAAAGFAEAVRAALGVPVELWDERLTTAEAHERLAAGGRSNRRRGDRIDAAAAAVLLQDYLDHRRGRS